MENLQQSFIRFALDSGALKLGDFTLKSGKKSPYFFNTGVFASGKLLEQLGVYYAQRIQKAVQESQLDFDVLFGSAYKGIPLVCATASALYKEFGIEKDFCFNRKEAKDHGEGGHIVGVPLQGKILMVDDVISSGITLRESIDLIVAGKGEPCAIAIAFDREEKSAADPNKTVVQQAHDDLGLETFSISSLSDLVTFLENEKTHDKELQSLLEYRQTECA